MRFIAAAALSLAAVVSAAAVGERRGYCMTDAAADRVANNFKGLIDNYSNASADRVLCTSYVDYTDSVIELINNGCPNGPLTLGAATFPSRAAFEAGQGGQPDIAFNILNVWHNCDTVTVRWYTPQPGVASGSTVSPQERVTGIVVIEAVRASGPEPWLIETTYSEFNSGAWLYDLGIFKPNCTS